MYNLSPEVAKPGCPLKEFLQHCLGKGLAGGAGDEIIEKILATIAAGESSTIAVNLGGGRTISIFAQPMAEGGWVMTHQDVSEQQRAKREADQAQKFLLTVIENVPSTVIVKDARELRYVLINKAGEKFYGLPRSKIIGRTVQQLFPAESAEAIAAQDKVLLKVKGELTVGTQMIETPANGFRQVMARRIAIRDASGTPQFLLSVLDDLTKS
jgi:PAS domain S-box-containing protein